MSLQHAAKHLSAHGRGPDTTLVHMSEGEVKSLNDLAMAAGGHLTINPHTGLPEAGFLSSMLPMIAGAALTAAGVPPPMAAMMVGGFQTARTGSLKQGLMAGLGAYGGAGIGSSLAASGTQAAALESTASAASTAPAVTPPSPSSIMVQPPVVAPSPTPSFDALTPDVTKSVIANPSPITPQSLGVKPLTPTPSVIGSGYESALAKQQAAFDAGTTGERLSTMGRGAQDVARPGGFGRFYENLANDPNTYGAKTTLAAAAAPTLAEAMKPKEPPPETPGDSNPGQQFDYVADQTTPAPMSDPSGREQKYFGQPRYVNRSAPRFAANGGMMASGGISDAQYNLGGYSDGGRLLRGPGDGVSDSIPAVIGKKQPARLADGEFVVPARIVSELGNGSTEAGARKLYAMMDRIQKARGKTVGKGKVAKNSRADRLLPA